MGTGHEGVVEGTALPEGEGVRHTLPPPAPASALSPKPRLPQKPRPLSLPPLEAAAVHHGAANPLDQHRAMVRPWSVAPVTLGGRPGPQVSDPRGRMDNRRCLTGSSAVDTRGRGNPVSG